MALKIATTKLYLASSISKHIVKVRILFWKNIYDIY